MESSPLTERKKVLPQRVQRTNMNKDQLGGRSNCRETGWGQRDGLGTERRAGGRETGWGQRRPDGVQMVR